MLPVAGVLQIVYLKTMTISNESSFVNGVPVCDQSVEMVKEFPYLVSVITSDGEIDADVKTRIAKPANVFGCLKKAIFTNQGLSLDIKHAVYKAVILATLLYESECWAVKVYHIQQLEVFLHRCVKCMLGVIRHQQWTEHLTNETLLNNFGMSDSLKCILMESG